MANNFIELPTQVLQESINSIINALPKAITAFLILFIGWLIAKISEIIIKKLLMTSNIDLWFKKLQLDKTLNINFSSLGGLIVKYYIMIIFFKEAASKAGLIYFAQMFDSLLTAVPQIIIGLTIIFVAVVFANFVKKKMSNALIPFNDVISEIIYGVIIFFAIVMALPKFGLTNTSLLEDSFKYIVLGFSLGISLAIGIGFGWAIKEGPARDFFKRKR